MGWLLNIFGALFGTSGGQQAVGTVAGVVDKAVYTAQEKSEDDTKDLESARAFAGVSNQPGVVNQLVDAANRLVRPGVTGWLAGGFIGWWHLPAPNSIDPYWQSLFYLVLTFWFGGRALLKDLPAAIKAMRG